MYAWVYLQYECAHALVYHHQVDAALKFYRRCLKVVSYIFYVSSLLKFDMNSAKHRQKRPVFACFLLLSLVGTSVCFLVWTSLFPVAMPPLGTSWGRGRTPHPRGQSRESLGHGTVWGCFSFSQGKLVVDSSCGYCILHLLAQRNIHITQHIDYVQLAGTPIQYVPYPALVQLPSC